MFALCGHLLTASLHDTPTANSCRKAGTIPALSFSHLSLYFCGQMMHLEVSEEQSYLVHNFALQSAGIDAVYLPLRVPQDTLAKSLDDLDGIGMRGFSVTIPHKQAAADYSQVSSESVRAIGAANTEDGTGAEPTGAGPRGGRPRAVERHAASISPVVSAAG